MTGRVICLKYLAMVVLCALAAVLADRWAAAAAAPPTIAITPNYAVLQPGASLQFAATVSGTPNTAVSWQVNNVNGGDPTDGTVSAGLFTAPVAIPVLPTATITAVSVADPSVTATATVTLVAQPATGITHYVATTGNDSNPGTLALPWRTIQHAANVVQPGDTVYVRAGVYHEAVTIARSGSASAGYITFSSYPGERATLDGQGVPITNGQWGLFTITDPNPPFAPVNDVIINGFELRNYMTKSLADVPIGIYMFGAGSNIQILNNHIHNIATTAPTNPNACGSDAFGLTLYGTETTPIDTLVISGNEIDHLKTGCSETLSLDGNVESFVIASNLVHDDNNIGIGAIGFERVGPEGLDQARNGVIRGNTVYNITSFGNPDYGRQYAADGIYVDGGADIVIEQNLIHHVDLGIELASEHHDHVTSDVIARNNVIYNDNTNGISIGGYANGVGGTDQCTIVNNTLFGNGAINAGQNTASGELQIQYHATNNVVENNLVDGNILHGTKNALFLNNFTKTPTDPASLDDNLYFSLAGANGGDWVWLGKTYQTYAAYRGASGQDGQSRFADPQFTTPLYDIAPTSPAVGAGVDLGAAIVGIVDFAGNPRAQNGAINIGAYQQ